MFQLVGIEFEYSLLEYGALTETAVIGKPDAERGSIVKAFVKLRVGYTANEELASELTEHVRSHLAAYKAPREITFVDSFEMTSSGKINRRILREREQALVEMSANDNKDGAEHER